MHHTLALNARCSFAPPHPPAITVRWVIIASLRILAQRRAKASAFHALAGTFNFFSCAKAIF
jgi:hypothetical protein